MNPIVEIDVTDEIEPLLERMAGKNQKAIKSAAKSLGYFLQKEIKQAIRSGSPGGSSFEERVPYDIRKALGDGSAARRWYGRMVNAIGYQYDNGVLRIGWTSRTAAMYGRKQEFGFRTRVTEEIRRHFAKAGYPLNENTQYIKLPARPVFDPMESELNPQIAPYVQERLDQYAAENVQFAKKSRRKYKVYG